MVYAKRADSPEVVLVASRLLNQLQPAPEQLRDRHVAPITPREIFQIELADLDPPVELIRSRGTWQMVAPLSRPANDAATEGLLTALIQLQATGFHDEPVDEDMFALDRPTATITLHASGRDGPVVFRLVQGADGRPSFMRVGESGSIFELPAESTRFLLAEAMTYCGTTLFALPAEADIERLGIHRRDGSYVLRPAENGWTFADGQALANADVVEQILARLRGLQAEQVVAIAANAPAALRQAHSNDAIRINIVTDSETAAEDGTVIQLVRVDREEFSGVYAWQPTAQPIIVGRFDEALFDELSVDLRALRIWDIPWRSVTRFSV